MTTFFSYPFSDFHKQEWHITISTGPVIVNKVGDKVLLHISSSTLKYQFIWGRLNDSLSPQENARARAKEVIWETPLSFDEYPPILLLDTIERNGNHEKLLLIHYRASIQDEENIGEAEWFSFSEVESLHLEDKLSSPNVLIATEKFLS